MRVRPRLPTKVPATALLTGLALVVATVPVRGQDAPTWQRGEEPEASPVTLFHSTQAINLPTTTLPGPGEWLFEISHRFVPPISETDDALFGLDGPVRLRLGLSWVPVDGAMVSLTRSNLEDNLDLTLRLRGYRLRLGVPVGIGVAAGLAWNTEAPGLRDRDSRTLQPYGQLVVDARLSDGLAVGVVPWILHNPDLQASAATTTVGVGIHGQLDLTSRLHALVEWNVSERRDALPWDAGSFGLQLETGGHFFKVVATNSLRLNPTQFLGGAARPFEPDEWRLGFNVTRLLRF